MMHGQKNIKFLYAVRMQCLASSPLITRGSI